MDVIHGTGEIVAEPDWPSLFNDELEIAAAREHWRAITTELRERELLAAANGHSVQRLVCAYLVFDRMHREVAEHGVVTKPRRGNAKAIARISPYFTAMQGQSVTSLTAIRKGVRQSTSEGKSRTLRHGAHHACGTAR